MPMPFSSTTIFPATPISPSARVSCWGFVCPPLLLGIPRPANFNLPYRALNIADFWRRWHITFSGWLRDYLYFSLPGPRTRTMPYVNLIVTMAIGGLWHGLSWTFLIWGLIH